MKLTTLSFSLSPLVALGFQTASAAWEVVLAALFRVSVSVSPERLEGHRNCSVLDFLVAFFSWGVTRHSFKEGN
jgi:hypothetical protein